MQLHSARLPTVSVYLRVPCTIHALANVTMAVRWLVHRQESKQRMARDGGEEFRGHVYQALSWSCAVPSFRQTRLPTQQQLKRMQTGGHNKTGCMRVVCTNEQTEKKTSIKIIHKQGQGAQNANKPNLPTAVLVRVPGEQTPKKEST